MIEVVAGVIVRENRILLAQRPPTRDFAFSWECSGGKVDGNESHHGALRRELKEELDLSVGHISEQALWSGWSRRENGDPVFLLFYRVISFEGVVHPREGQGWGWFTKHEFRGLGLTPGNRLAFDALLRTAWPPQNEGWQL